MELPSNPEAERMIVGCAMLDSGLIPYLVSDLSASDFFRPTMAAMFTAIRELHLAGSDVNPVTVVTEILRRESLSGSGASGVNHAVVAETLDGVPRFSRPESVKSYVEAVRRTALQRRILRYAEALSVNAVQRDVDPAELLMEMSQAARNMGENTTLFTDLIDTKSAMERTLLKLEESWGREDDLLGLSTGFIDLDQHLLGLQPGVYVIAAGPNIGKTTFVLNVVNNILLEAQRKNEVRVGAIISMEMGVESLSVKLLATRARLSTRDIKRGNLTREQQGELLEASVAFKRQPLHFVEGFASITPSAIAAKLEHLRATHGRLDFLVIDYLQLLTSDAGGSEYQAISEISREMKRLSHRYKIPILLVSQLSRKYADRSTKDYQLTDLRGSGAIEQDADVVMFLMPRDWENESNPERRLVIAKDREGAKYVTIPLIFFGEQSRFESASFTL